MGSHILVFPYPAQGHMLALLDLTHHLATNGLTITILVTPKNLPILSPLLSSSPNIQPLVLPFPPHPTLPPGVENVKDIGNHGNIPITTSLAKLHDQLIQWFRAHLNPPVAMISDFFLGWSQHLADQLEIPRICFFSTRAFLTLLLDYCCRNISLVRSQDTTVFHELPNSPSFAWEHLPSLIRYMEYLRKFLGHGRVFGVGPVSLIGGSDPMTRERSVSGSDFDVVGWLDGKGDGSVVYVCFGSQKFLTSYQLEALVIGLEDSGVGYVLVVKPEQDGLVRAGSGRGVVIKGWAPQEAILNHRAVGGFVSHCGWNSVLEAVLAGVMILAWPMEADQYVNARLLVEEHGVAVRVCEGPNTVPDSARLARTIAESMSGDKVEKLKAKEMKNKAIEAVKEGGSSSLDLERLVKELSSFSEK
ncbi:putative UDP-glucuronosyl/UDP-glucosyltransferase [Helianthus debilis subsp. tardiflorus]